MATDKLTPLLHRVHHGPDADFLDKNYGGFSSCGTSSSAPSPRTRREPDYGVTAGIRSWRRTIEY
jgi:hypothetical protein